jgi:hypothetical protein
MNFSFLDDLFGGLGNGLAGVDKFVDREMPFDSGWGFPAALTAAYFAPQLIPAFAEGGAGLGAAEGAGATAGAEGSIGSGGMNSLLSSLGLDGGSFPAQEGFQLASESYTPEYLNMLADYQGVQADDRSIWDIITGNTEQGLYNKEATASQQTGKTLTEMLKKKQQQSALDQLGKTSSGMQQQGNAQQAEQNRMPQLQAMMSRGQPVNTTAALLSLLQDREQQLRQPRISLI